MRIMRRARKSVPKSRRGAADGGLLLKLQLPSDPSLLCTVRGAVERLTEAFGFSPPDCRAVTRAVDEALTNIIRHAYGGALDRPIELAFRSTMAPQPPGDGPGPGLEIVMSDRGPAVDPEKLCGRALSDVKPGGLGLHFIRQSMDVVEFKRAKGANHLRLVKYVRAPKEAANLVKG
jgi:anti-sigma regulatory factor (Ser/Thr protein kinase)